MRAIVKRLQRLEKGAANHYDPESQRQADLLWERRRRRLQASGQPFEDARPERNAIAPGRRLSIGETLQLGRLQAHESNRAAEIRRK